jgi:hypothetical protein
MMRLLLVTILVGTAFAGAAIADPITDGLAAKADACIKARAPEVVAKAASINDAVNFLVSDLCAVQIRNYSAYSANSRLVADWRATLNRTATAIGPTSSMDSFDRRQLEDAQRSREQLTKIAVDPGTGDLNAPAGFDPPLEGGATMSALLRNLNSDAGFRAVAAEAVLAAKHPASAMPRRYPSWRRPPTR